VRSDADGLTQIFWYYVNPDGTAVSTAEPVTGPDGEG
jgi:hypothetical protein